MSAVAVGDGGRVGVTEHEAALRRLELLVTRRLEGTLHGDHHGLVPGGGSEPGEGRVYRPGDDVRRMDWNVTARSYEPHVRDTIADRELETWVVVDGSASLDFGTALCEKRDLATAAVAAFAFLTARAGNRVGAIALDTERPRILPPRGGREAMLALLHDLIRRPRSAGGAGAGSGGNAALAAGIRRAALTARRRGLVVIVSDFLDADTDAWARELRALSSRHEVVCVEARDPRDAELPPVGLLTLVDPETGRLLEVQTSGRRVRERFAAAAASQREAIARSIRGAGANHLILSTDRDWLLDVVKFVAARRRRR